MKKLLFGAFIVCTVISHAQTRPYTIASDTVLLKSFGSHGTALVIRSATKDSIGFLYNTGNGVTIFKRALVQINDTTYLIGRDTLHTHGSGGGGSGGTAIDTVRTIAALENYLGTGRYIYVTDTLRGGFFSYVTGTYTPDSTLFYPANGKGSGYWSRNMVNNDKVWVTWAGATKDSTQDATPFIQLAINSAIANNHHIVFFPAGFYWCSGALVTSENGVNPNSQLYIPPSVTTSSLYNTFHLTFLGEGKPDYSMDYLYQDGTYSHTGSIIKSTITGSGTNPAVFGGQNPGLMLNYVSFEKLKILVPANAGSTGPTMSGINGINYASLMVTDCIVGIDTTLFRDTIPQNQVAGIITCRVTSQTMSTVKNSLVYGFRYGIIAGEHCLLENSQVANCYAGFVFIDNSHSVAGTKIGSFWNKHDVLIPNTDIMGITAGTQNVDISLLDIEAFNISPRWFNNAGSVLDSGNRATGNIGYLYISTGGILGNIAFTQYSGAGSPTPKLRAVNLITNIQPADLTLSPDQTTSTTSLQFGAKYLAAYHGIAIGDAAILHQGTGDLVIQTAGASGVIKLSTGATPQMTLNLDGSLTIDPAGYIVLSAASNVNTGIVYQNGGTAQWYGQNFGTGGANRWRLANASVAEQFSVTQAGAVRFNAYGAGSATFDASGNITSVSDERLKNIQGFYTTGLKELMKIKPIRYKWNKLSGNEMDSTYAGFSAQNVKANIPYGTGQDKRGYLSLQDRAIIATLVNAVKEQQKEIEDLKKEIKGK